MEALNITEEMVPAVQALEYKGSLDGILYGRESVFTKSAYAENYKLDTVFLI